jgi:hypothetical protein
MSDSANELMPRASIWKERPSKLDELARRVELGEFVCAHNPTMGFRNPGTAPRDPKQGCEETATHIKTIKRTFVMGTWVLDVPLCDEHASWYF